MWRKSWKRLILEFRNSRTTKTAFEVKSVQLQFKKMKQLNLKSKYNCCAFPRLTIKLGKESYDR